MKKNYFSLSLWLLLFYLCSCNNSNTGTTTQNEANAAPEVKAVFINGDSIHYIDIGKGDPIVLVHGVMGDYRTWETQTDVFSRNHRVIVYSLRYGYPNKQTLDSTADYSLSQNTKDLIILIKALKLEPVHLVGHSSGAFATLITTIEHPELVRSLTLAEPPVMSLLKNVPGGDTLEKNFWKAVFPAIELFKNNDDEKAAEIFVHAVMDDSQYFAKHPQRMREIIMANTAQLKGSILYPKTVFPPVSCNDLKKIKTPVLLVEGDQSPLFLTSIIDELERCLGNKEKATLPHTSHGLEYENPAEFNKVVLGFIDKN
ncbi:alpha/beta fold hydrolase [Agriterribacter humi]|uniref:alpha/beta fold hydrolase n=1 Tax=Agriterribacter humi TaxID=1104781 RepID=UPI00186B36FC|nr:alpha/beta hydrolase [Agriterribacter humi]